MGMSSAWGGRGRAGLPGKGGVLLLWLVCLSAVLGCQTVDYYDQTVEQPVQVDLEPPRELAKMSLPEYRIEPPDVIRVELAKLVPIPPYKVAVFDVLQIDVTGTLLDQPINGLYLVESEGTVNLGPAYGTVRVVGMSIEEVRGMLDAHLRQIIRQPEVSVQLAQATGMQEVTGEYLLSQDGTINLRQYGLVHLAGKTLAEAKMAIEAQLSQSLESPEVWLDVASYNSKVYYVITEGAGLGDNVVRIPITGNETVLDAVAQVQGLSQVSSTTMWVARPAPGGCGIVQQLPVDWEAISQGGSTATNYQIMPGDRLFIAENELVAATNFVNTLVSPVERLMGFTSLGVSMIRNIQYLGRNNSSYYGL